MIKSQAGIHIFLAFVIACGYLHFINSSNILVNRHSLIILNFIRYLRNNTLLERNPHYLSAGLCKSVKITQTHHTSSLYTSLQYFFVFMVSKRLTNYFLLWWFLKTGFTFTLFGAVWKQWINLLWYNFVSACGEWWADRDVVMWVGSNDAENRGAPSRRGQPLAGETTNRTQYGEEGDSVIA